MHEFVQSNECEGGEGGGVMKTYEIDFGDAQYWVNAEDPAVMQPGNVPWTPSELAECGWRRMEGE